MTHFYDDVDDSRLPVRKVTPKDPLPVKTVSRNPGFSDVFGRLRVSTPATVFEGKTLYDKNPDVFVEEITGTGTSTFVDQTGKVTMATSATSDLVIRQSRFAIPYQPGKSQFALMTFNMNGQEDGIVKRVGIFDGYNGVFLEVSDDIYFCKRDYADGYAVDTKIPQSEWNLDKMDGTGNSGFTLDFTKVQIFGFDFQWLGVGSIRYGFFVGGEGYYCHQSDHSNDITRPWTGNPNCPMRYEIEATTGTTGSMDAICCTTLSEGGLDHPGRQKSIARTAATAIVGGQEEPILGVRLAADKVKSFVSVVHAEVLSLAANADFTWYLVRNPTFTGGSAASWVAADGGNSCVEYDQTADGLWNGDGVIIETGLGSRDIAVDSNENRVIGFTTLGMEVDQTPDEIYLIVRPTSNADVSGSLTWTEYK